MKTLTGIIGITLLSALLIVPVAVFAQPQGVETPTPNDYAGKQSPAVSSSLIAYHDIKREPDPYEEGIADILFFISESFGNRAFSRSDSGNSSDVLLNDMVKKVELARDLLENGSYEKACQELTEVYSLSDSLKENSSFVNGSAVPKLAKKIEIFEEKVIGCK